MLQYILQYITIYCNKQYIDNFIRSIILYCNNEYIAYIVILLYPYALVIYYITLEALRVSKSYICKFSHY